MQLGWEALGLIITVLLFFGGILVGVIQSLLKGNQKHVDRRFEALETDLKARLDGVNDVRSELKDYKAFVANEYVHREDFVRVEGAREVKLDRINEKINDLTAIIYERLPAS